ncbi:HAMP domain-containing histidine kinase [Clostridium botulinum]|uniref:histidine kinase n=1 Tax=Clostridium botulinum C/D str. DC5 TaxID=1443128 RepID=A0A0A0II81_CLOBO|nr:HAMP domain-containing sensor histidine kinase [Clostridium botulinum]KGN00673.1 histidine kinase [Clostridium botulinum C/D str. DC5]KOC55499.1 histidine kinase [Clostridium botulinum]KOC56295.1 histidine kinase [Clostridium botulinum]MCD3233447.1 HAMP domain-containing histidine kinase [Clostridium botulinum D/C]MCD3239196.1 HAMP domain-containing histidine kinase [Clostridium botulinum D/C]
MILIICILMIIIIILFIHLMLTKKEIRNIEKQLKNINENNENNKLTISLINKDIEKLGKSINDTLDLKRQSESNNIRLQGQLKKTIANMSHDLRTPLTSIIGYIQFCKLDDIDEKEKNEFLDIAEKRANSLKELLNDFYELSLIESLDYEIKLEKINISRILQEILLGRYSDFLERDLDPKIQIQNDNIHIIGDKKSIERVIENLLSNSIKYAKENLKVYLGIEKETVILKISNTVDHLDSLDVEKIYDRFYMADKNRSGKGTGLGLSIVRSLIEKMNGSIEANKHEGVLNICCIFKYCK